jgi:hypothetical protein
MKRTLPIFLLLFSAFLTPFNSRAQTHLTNRQVYDFNVGDVFETESQGDNSVPTYRITKVLQKWTSVTSDTIYYVDSAFSYVPWTWVGPGSYSAGKDTTLITQLDSNVALGGGVSNCSCNKMKDTVYNDSIYQCGRKVEWRLPDTSCTNHCFEPVTMSQEAIEGCGAGYGYYNDLTVPMYSKYVLIYYKKGTETCGSYYLGVEDIKNNTQSVKVYPNPATDKFTLAVQSTKPLLNGRVEVYNVLGEMVYTSSVNPSEGGTSNTTISLSGQTAGVYFVKLISDTGVNVVKVIKE